MAVISITLFPMRSFVFQVLASLLLAWGQNSLMAQSALPDHQRQESRREATPAADREEHEDLQAASRYWYESRNPKHLPAMEAALKKVLPLALMQSPWITSMPTWEEAHHHRAYHDAGAVLLAKCYTLLYYGRVAEARSSLELVDTRLRYSLQLLPDRTARIVRKSLHYHEHACALYGAIISKKLDVFEFTPERDGYDADAQRQAAADMAMLRLREGNYDALDYYVSQARTRRLKTSSGQWVSEMIYRGIYPPENEVWSEAAWKEMGDRVKEWQKSKPKSIDAHIATLVYSLYFMAQKRPDNDQSLRTLVTAMTKMLDELDVTESPIVAQLRLFFSIALQDQFSITAGFFHRSYESFPDNYNLIVMMHVRLMREKEGQSLSSKFITEIGKSKHPEMMAVSLAELPLAVVFNATQQVDRKLIASSIHKALEVYPNSLEVRNDMGRLAVMVKMPELAREIMEPIGDHWDREKWKGLEEEAARITERKLKVASRRNKGVGA